MSYRERLLPNITLTSPTGQVFTAKWSGDSRSREKQLGVFKTPGVTGAKIQDLDLDAWSYPLTIYFDGKDNDKDAEKFTTALSERGSWTVIHPVKGEKTLQLVSFSEAIQPVTSGNITVVSTEWLEVTDFSGEVSGSQLSSSVISLDTLLQSTGADQFNGVVSLNTADKIGAFTGAVNNVANAFNVVLTPITDTVATVQAQADSIKRGIDTGLDGVIDVLSIAGQVQALVALPNQIVTDINSKLDTYQRFADTILSGSPENASPANINVVAVQELTLTATIGAVGVASVATELTTRQAVIDSVGRNLGLFNTVTDGLDVVQEIFEDENLNRSYFSQSQSYVDAAQTVAKTVEYLIKSAFDLAVEKKILLTEPTNPVMIAMQEYDGPGEGDENINLFYESNELSGNECLLLPVGKVVVVYV